MRPLYNGRGNAYAAKADIEPCHRRFRILRSPTQGAYAFNSRGVATRPRVMSTIAIADYDQGPSARSRLAVAATIGAERTKPRATSTAPSRTMARRSVSIPLNATAHKQSRAGPMRSRATMNRAIRRLRRCDPHRRELCPCLRQSRQPLTAKGRSGSRHRGLRSGDPAATSISHCLEQSRTRLYGEERTDRAMADYNEAIRLNPKFPVAFNNRGTSLLRKKDYARPSPTTPRRFD